MKQAFILFSLFFLVYSCGNSNESTAESVIETLETIAVDSSVILEEPIVESIPISEQLQTILDKSPATHVLPFLADTNFVKSIEIDQKANDDALSFEDVNYLAANCVENLPTINASYILISFCNIDSIKSVGEYDNYVASLDIGMMKYSDAYVEGIVEIDPRKNILMWSITYSTYEACPYASGTVLFGTYLYNNEVKNTLVLAEISGGGDPPYWGEMRVSSEITASLIKTGVLDRSNGYDEESDTEKIMSNHSDYKVEVGEEELIAPALPE